MIFKNGVITAGLHSLKDLFDVLGLGEVTLANRALDFFLQVFNTWIH